MYPTDDQLLDEAHRIFEMSKTREMYADQLAKTIAAQLNAREGGSRFLHLHDARVRSDHDFFRPLARPAKRGQRQSELACTGLFDGFRVHHFSPEASSSRPFSSRRGPPHRFAEPHRQATCADHHRRLSAEVHRLSKIPDAVAGSWRSHGPSTTFIWAVASAELSDYNRLRAEKFSQHARNYVQFVTSGLSSVVAVSDPASQT